eukprot:768640-Hanusia_phi.AAC.4
MRFRERVTGSRYEKRLALLPAPLVAILSLLSPTHLLSSSRRRTSCPARCNDHKYGRPDDHRPHHADGTVGPVTVPPGPFGQPDRIRAGPGRAW